ncbi:hypothetical protein HTY54_09415 [Escherichia coli]|nr:hypothetical protein [Escherichia coli]
MQSWYLLYCKRGQLQRARGTPRKTGCELPGTDDHPWKKSCVANVLQSVSHCSPNYLFVEFDPEVIHTTTINATRGVSHFVRFGASPAIVPSAVIHQLSVYKPKDIVDPATPLSG